MLDFGHAVFLGFGGFAGHARHARGRCRVVDAGAAAAAGRARRAVWSPPCSPAAVATKRGETAFAMITLGLAELVVAAGADVPRRVRRRGGPQRRPLRRPGAVRPRFRHAVARLLPDRRVGVRLRLPDVALHRARRSAALPTPCATIRSGCGFIGYDPARIRFLVFACPACSPGIAGGLQALNDEIVTSANISSEASGAVLLMTFIGGVGTFWGPVLGAILVTFLQVALSTVTDAWQLYSGLLFIAAVVWAPGGLSGIILAHAPLVRAGPGGRLVPSYAAQLPGLAAGAGRRSCSWPNWPSACRRSATAPGPARVLGLAADPHSAVAVARRRGAGLARGALLLRCTWPRGARRLAGGQRRPAHDACPCRHRTCARASAPPRSSRASRSTSPPASGTPSSARTARARARSSTWSAAATRPMAGASLLNGERHHRAAAARHQPPRPGPLVPGDVAVPPHDGVREPAQRAPCAPGRRAHLLARHAGYRRAEREGGGDAGADGPGPPARRAGRRARLCRPARAGDRRGRRRRRRDGPAGRAHRRHEPRARPTVPWR